MRCPNCSEEIKDTAKWCGHCGHKIEQKVAVPPPPTRELIPPEPEPVEPVPEEKVVEEAPVVEEEVFPDLEPESVPEELIQEVVESPPQPAKQEKEPVQPEKAEAALNKEEELTRSKKKSKVPVWVWIVGLIMLGAGVVFGLTKIPQQIAVSKACSAPVFTKTYKPLRVTYGYWGFLKDFERENLDALSCKFIIEGDAYPLSDDVNLVSTADVPCAKISPGSFCDENECYWLTYTTKIVNGFAPGRYKVDIECSASYSIRDGLRDDYGMLISYGPGNILDYDFILIVE